MKEENAFLADAMARYAEKLCQLRNGDSNHVSVLPAHRYIVAPKNLDGVVAQTRISHAPEMGTATDKIVKLNDVPWVNRGQAIRYWWQEGLIEANKKHPGLIASEIRTMQLQNALIYEIELENSVDRTLIRACAALDKTAQRSRSEAIAQAERLISAAELTTASGRYIEGLKIHQAKLKAV